jgi:hypothetical protein
VSITLGWTGQLAVGRGGTGASTLTGVLIGNGTSAVNEITGKAWQILRRNTGNTAYEFWSANYLVNPMTLEGSIIYATTGGTPAELFANNTSTNKYLRSVNGTAPTWEALPASVSGSGTTNYVSKWTSSTTLGDSLIYDNGTNVGIGTATTQTRLTTYDSGNLFAASFGGASSTPNIVALGTVSSTPTINGYSYDFGLSTSLQLQSHGGNVGIGTASPSWKLDVNGVIGLAGTAFAEKSGNYNVLYDGSGAASIYIGGTTANLNAYSNTLHSYQNRGGTVEFATISGDGLNVKIGRIQLPSTNYITWGGAYGTDIPTISGTSGSGSNGFLQFYPAGSTSGVKMALRRTGQLALPSYTSSSAFTGTSVATLAVDAAGDVITIAPQQTTASGTYTPTWTGLANVDSVTSFSSQYMRVGDTVTVSGWVTINATADNTPTSLSFSLPINSNTSSVNYLNGTGVAQGGGAAACLSGYGSNFGEFEVLPSVDTAINYSFHFTYRIV